MKKEVTSSLFDLYFAKTHQSVAPLPACSKIDIHLIFVFGLVEIALRRQERSGAIGSQQQVLIRIIALFQIDRGCVGMFCFVVGHLVLG